jgi:hypothetical protein
MEDGGAGWGRATGDHSHQRNREAEDADQGAEQQGYGLKARTVGIFAVLTSVLSGEADGIRAGGGEDPGVWGLGLDWGVHRRGTGPGGGSREG